MCEMAVRRSGQRRYVLTRRLRRSPPGAEPEPFYFAHSEPPVEPTESTGQHDRHDRDACAEDERVARLAQIEVSDATDEQVADGQVEEAPQDVDCRGGQTLPRR